MNNILRTISTVDPSRLGEIEIHDEQGLSQATKAFQNRVQTALSLETLASIGHMSYGDHCGCPAVKFQAGGRAFELRQTIGSYVNLSSGDRELFQCNLSNPNAKDRFVEALGNALAAKE